jgi:hypothetical protein
VETKKATFRAWKQKNIIHPEKFVFLGRKNVILSSWEDRKKHSENEQQHHTQTQTTQLEHHKPHKLMHTNLIYQCILI